MPARAGYLLAIDVGSTTTRCILFDLDGRPVGEAYFEPRVYHPQPTWTEVAPEDWWKCTFAAIRQVLRDTGMTAQEVLAVGLCGLKHALVPVDSTGKPLARAQLWMDQRCQPQAEWMEREHGDAIREATGGEGTMSTTPSAPKLRWIVEHQPDLVRDAARFLLAKDFVRFRLTGEVATDPSDAGGTRLYDARRGSWSPRMLEIVGVPPEKLPPILPSTAIAGEVTAEAALATGLAEGTPVVVGAGDVQSTLIGANALGSTLGCLYLGTAAWISLPGPEGGSRKLSAECFGATATTGAALKWLSSILCGAPGGRPSPPYAALLEEAEHSPLGARGLVFLPHLMGERAPQDDPRARGTLYGLTLAHDRGDVTRAVLEGCAFQLRCIVESMGSRNPVDGDPALHSIVTVGGGARSRLWGKIIADVLGRRLLLPRVLEAGALGAAILAGVGIGVYGSIGEAAGRLVQIESRIEPDRAQHRRYEESYSLFLELEARLAPLYRRVAGDGAVSRAPHLHDPVAQRFSGEDAASAPRSA